MKSFTIKIGGDKEGGYDSPMSPFKEALSRSGMGGHEAMEESMEGPMYGPSPEYMAVAEDIIAAMKSSAGTTAMATALERFASIMAKKYGE